LNIESVEGKNIYNIHIALDAGKEPFSLEDNEKIIKFAAGAVLTRIIGNII
jgi:hypothetical protein